MTEKPKVNAAALAKLYNMNVSSVYKSVKSGRIPAYVVGPKLGALRFDLDEVGEALRRPASNGKQNGEAVLVGQDGEMTESK